jgi:hypothetical protein
MKLTSAQVKETLSQLPCEVIPDSHPVVPQLNSLFGEHTFFIDDQGLNIVEPAEAGETAVRSAKVVNVANWSAADPKRLEPHAPEPTDVVVTLGPKH